MLDLMMTEQSIGARGSARTHVEAFGQPQELEIGYFARGDSVNNVQYLDDRATQAPYATNASLSGILGDLALYADTSLKPVSWVTLRGGLREELFTYDVEDHCPTATPACDETPEPAGNPRTSLANSALLPRGSLLLGAFDGFTFVGSFGRGVRSLAIDEVTAAPTPSLATISSYEGGVSYARTLPAGSLSLSSVFYGTQISRDEIFDPTAGRTVDTGATSRAGWTGLARFTGRFFDELANVAAVRGIVDGTDEAIPYVPHVMARSDTALFGDLPWAIQRAPGAGVVRARGHVRRDALAPVRPDERRVRSRRRRAEAELARLRAGAHGDEPPRHPVPLERVHLHLRLPHAVAAGADPGAVVHGRRSADAVPLALRHSRRLMRRRAVRRRARRPRRATAPISGSLRPHAAGPRSGTPGLRACPAHRLPQSVPVCTS